MTATYEVRRQHLRTGDVIQKADIVMYWNMVQQSGIMQSWRLLRRVTELDGDV